MRLILPLLLGVRAQDLIFPSSSVGNEKVYFYSELGSSNLGGCLPHSAQTQDVSEAKVLYLNYLDSALNTVVYDQFTLKIIDTSAFSKVEIVSSNFTNGYVTCWDLSNDIKSQFQVSLIAEDSVLVNKF